ncbi:unnamed protein product [Allacma fusca]|uniref:Enoyl reductase (ER) domain-containing protein n=1 Tax=Allacma fusca TaxID=39272 RepID=A0A8J2JV28_9HEXA|nr:unnamed protein product [Allacma fusca]
MFHSAVQRIPSHAVVIEIAPHGLFQTILKRSLHETCVSISLTDRNQSSAPFFLRSVGKLFVSGLQPKINKLYPELQFPLRSAAPPLSLLIQWNHQDSWKVAGLPANGTGNDFEINLENPAQEFYCGYKINGQLLFPPSGFLVSIWRVLAEKVGTSMDRPITFENIVFNSVCYTSTQYVTKFICNINTSGDFEILENGNSVVTGSVRFEDAEMFKTEDKVSENDKVYTQAEVYDRLRKVGYEFSGSFKSLIEVEVGSHWGSVAWHENLAVLLESLLQLEIFPNLSNQALLPFRIQKVTIDVGCLRDVTGQRIRTHMIISRDKNLKLVSCTGIEIRGVQLLPVNCFGDFNPDSENIKANLAAESLPNLLLGFGKELAKQNIVGSYIAIEQGILGLLNDFAVNTVGTIGSRQTSVEFSGVVSGQKVMGLAKFQAGTVQLISVVHWRIPDTWSLRDAATVPTAYATAYYALIVRGTLKHKENILIQHGDEAVGEAAIAIALNMKCNVYTTVSSAENKQILLKRFPALNPAKILSSKCCHNLEKMIQEETNGKGANLVLNSFSGDLTTLPIRCIAEYGRFLQLMDGGFENPHNRKFHETTIGLSIFLKSVSFHGICKDILNSSREEDSKIVHNKLQEGIGLGIVRPLAMKHVENAQLKDSNWLQPRSPGLTKIVFEI